MTRCMQCMKEYNGEKCPHCGYVNGSAEGEHYYLSEGTVLHERYIIGKVLGHGGFGITYMGFDQKLGLCVAVKEYLPAEMSTRAEGDTTVKSFSGDKHDAYVYGLGRFIDEAKTMAQFETHPCIVAVKDFFEANNTAYIVMEYLDGITLSEYLKRSGGRISVDETLSITRPIIDALKAVHKSGIIHRDISPDNIYILTNSQVKLLDFGAARHAMGEKSKSLSVVLKPGYAPPEQYYSRGKQGSWTDVYALAATMVKMLTGETPPEAMERVVGDTWHLPSGMPQQLIAVLTRALAVNAEDRYSSMDTFYAAVFKYMAKGAEASVVHSAALSAEEELERTRQKLAEQKRASEEALKRQKEEEARVKQRELEERLEPQYQKAMVDLAEGRYNKAYDVFRMLRDYKNSPKFLAQARDELDKIEQEAKKRDYDKAAILFDNKEYADAERAFERLGDFRDSRVYYNRAKHERMTQDYQKAIEHLEAKQYWDAEYAFKSLGSFADSEKHLKNLKKRSLRKKLIITATVVLVVLAVVLTLIISHNQYMKNSLLKNPELEKVIKTKMQEQGIDVHGYIDESELAQMRSLEIEFDLTQDEGLISFIQYATNLEKLDLSSSVATEIMPTTIFDTDIRFLSNLKNLRELHLAYVSGDISVLSNLTNLEELYLTSNAINDISALSGLKNLHILDLSYNHIDDLGALSDLTNLQSLSLSRNYISDVSALSELKDLQYFYLSSNDISDISALSGLKKLQVLSLDVNQISDISALSSMKDLRILTLYLNQISDIGALSGLSNLEELYLYDGNTNSIDELDDWKNFMTEAVFEDKALEQVIRDTIQRDGPIFMEDLREIRELEIGTFTNVDISSFSDLQMLENLEVLKLGAEFVSKHDMSAFEEALSQLADDTYIVVYVDDIFIGNNDLDLYADILDKVPYLDGIDYFWPDDDTVLECLNYIVKNELTFLGLDQSFMESDGRLQGLMKAIGEADSLQYLIMDSNDIDDIRPLKGLYNLLHLEIYSSKIENFEPISDIENLQTLYVQSYEATNLDSMQGLGSMASLRSISIRADLTDISGLASLANLEELELFYLDTDICSLAPLASLTQLQKLSIYSIAARVDYDVLAGLNPTELYLENAADCDFVSNMTNLKRVSLPEADIDDLAPLSGLDIEYLYLSGCENLFDFSPLIELENLKKLDVHYCENFLVFETQYDVSALNAYIIR